MVGWILQEECALENWEGDIKAGPAMGYSREGHVFDLLHSVAVVCLQEELGARSWPSSQSLLLLR